MLKTVKKRWEKFKQAPVWKSVVRRGYSETPRNRALAIFGNVFMHLHPVTMPRRLFALSHTWCMGGTTFLLFLILTVTGVLLMFYYRPTVPAAYLDVKDLEFTVPFGVLLRNMHRWTAHLMVITVMLHMYRVFMTGSYKPPREFNWVVGVVLLVTTFLLSFTGYLLTWDQLGFWAITVGTNMAGATPFLGHEGPFSQLLGLNAYNDVRFALLGGASVGENALLRAYVWHCIALPLIVCVFMTVHFWRVRKDNRIKKPL